MYGYGPGSMMGGYGLFGGLLMIVFWILVIVGVVLLIKWFIDQSARGTGHAPASDRALDVLKERYARGEVAKDEFEQVKKDLMQ